jgi:hypothetical protein
MFRELPFVDMFRDVPFGASAKADKQGKKGNDGPQPSLFEIDGKPCVQSQDMRPPGKRIAGIIPLFLQYSPKLITNSKVRAIKEIIFI